MNGAYTTKVMKPSNMAGLAKARELLEEELVRAEMEKSQGTVSVELMIKDGGTYRVKKQTNKETIIQTEQKG